MRHRGSIIPGLLLILFGLFLLLERMDFYFFRWSLILPLLAVLGGIMMWGGALRSTDRGGIFPGTLLVVFGAFFFAWNYGAFDPYWNMQIWPVFPAAFGLAFLSMALVRLRNWWAVFPAVPLLTVSGVAFAYYLEFIDWYTVEDLYYRWEDYLYLAKDYYPVIFIIIGLIIILSSVRRNRKTPPINTP